MMPSSLHDGTSLLASQAGPVVGYTPRSAPSSIGSSPQSSGSSSSSLTITRSPVARVEQTSHDGQLHALQTQANEQGHTPPPAYASLGLNAPPSPWCAPTLSSSRPRPPPVSDAPAPVFDLYTAHTHQFGPTPLSRAATVPFAAYIEAPGAPDRRAYRRFVSALVVAIGLFVALSIAAGLEIVGEGGLGWARKFGQALGESGCSSAGACDLWVTLGAGQGY